ncbi:MAG TPA: hypothetical protein VK453_06190 [Micromonosporaceae bacterium]|nr:hypothetical protein [Micromonosporaceae bacterium]
MPDLLPRMALDPPPGYVAFVQRHLEPLRRDAMRVVGEQCHPDELYPEVLTDVAARWGWLELLSTRLGRPRAADAYLQQAFARQSQRWRSDQPFDGDQAPTEFEVWHTDVDWSARGAGPARISAALRLAPQIPIDPADAAPVAEASIAWLHAYAARRRIRITVAVVAFLLFFMAVLRVSTSL